MSCCSACGLRKRMPGKGTPVTSSAKETLWRDPAEDRGCDDGG